MDVGIRTLARKAWRQIGVALATCGFVAGAAVAETGRVRVGEAEIAFQTMGQSGPVVVFESGRGEDMRGWKSVAQPLSACLRVVLQADCASM